MAFDHYSPCSLDLLQKQTSQLVTCPYVWGRFAFDLLFNARVYSVYIAHEEAGTPEGQNSIGNRKISLTLMTFYYIFFYIAFKQSCFTILWVVQRVKRQPLLMALDLIGSWLN